MAQGNGTGSGPDEEIFDQFNPRPRKGASDPSRRLPPAGMAQDAVAGKDLSTGASDRRPGRTSRPMQSSGPDQQSTKQEQSQAKQGGRRGAASPRDPVPGPTLGERGRQGAKDQVRRRGGEQGGQAADAIETLESVGGSIKEGFSEASSVLSGDNSRYENSSDIWDQAAKQPKTMGDRVDRGKRLAASVAEGAGGNKAKAVMDKAPGGFSSEGAENGREQAVNDTAKVAGAVGAKAAYGDFAGAALNGLSEAVKSQTGKKVMAGAIAAALVGGLAIAGLVGIVTGSFGGDGAAATTQVVSPEGISLTAAVETLDGQAELDEIRRAAIQYGVPWQMLAAVWYATSSSNLSGGKGPFNISDDVVGKSTTADTISTTDAMDTAKASGFIASALSAGYHQHMYGVGATDIDAGVGDGLDEDGLRDRQLLEDDRSVEDQEKSREGWLEVIRSLPVTGVDSKAEVIHATALAWMMGDQPANQVCLDPEAGLSGGGIATNVGTTTANLNASQVAYAQTIINTVNDMGMPQQAAVVALATVAQESTFRMWWNVKVPGSEALTPEKGAKGRDGYSVGLYQQQVNGNKFAWGTVADAMDPVRSTQMFINALKKVNNWESLPITVAAQRVQASAHPSKYAKWENQARQLVKDLPPTSNGGGWSHGDHDHEEVVEAGAESTSGELKEAANPHGLKVDSTLKPDVQLVQSAVVKYFGPTVNAMGGYRAGSVGHSQRIATDLMIVDYKNAGKANGDKLAEFLIANRAALGVDYLIWRDRIWMGPNKGWEPYSKGGFGKHLGGWDDTTLHHDHIHVETFGSTGTGGALVGGNGDMSVGGTAGTGADGCSTGGMAGSSPVSYANASFMGVDDYPHKNPVGDVSWRADSKDPGPDAWGMYKRECVSFVAWRMNQLMGWQEGQPYPFTKSTMKWDGSANARYWGKQLSEMGYKVDMTPAVGAIAWWDSFENKGWPVYEPGHVAVVLAVNGDGTVLLEQYNGGTVAGNPSKARYSQMTVKASVVSGYIHVADVDTSGAPAADDKKDEK